MLPTIQAFRKLLHQYPELSGKEQQTAQRVKEFIQTHNPTQILEQLGGHGLASIYTFGNSGPTIVIRCELDALPISESNTFTHQSKINGVAHKCGHDGHMAIVAGLIFWIQKQTFNNGRIVLLFQPAEETGKGAYQILQDQRFSDLQPDYFFALHNLPGYPLHTIITKSNSFSASVQSMAIHFTGKEAHASEPENGLHPALAIAQIIQSVDQLNQPDLQSDDFGLITLVHTNIGSKAYGISPGTGELHYTIRAWTDEQRQYLEEQIEAIIANACQQYQLQHTIHYLEYFPATQNDPFCNDLIHQVAANHQFVVEKRPIPLKFGEDFGWFSKESQVAMFGLGAGEKTPALHHATYDFPDELIPTGIQMFGGIIASLLNR